MKMGSTVDPFWPAAVELSNVLLSRERVGYYSLSLTRLIRVLCCRKEIPVAHAAVLCDQVVRSPLEYDASYTVVCILFVQALTRECRGCSI